ncbi:active spliceosome conformation promoter CWC2 [Aspergillus saccharolyticus JOP 1030-1]|uniref:Pre-mRNA-splicing factor CWC2 n=1 Tax=Aspergillus saccharolyticus JOP 1030-1 TaxID=1450539 RepID=A0A318ZSD4_9EURO|nr:hypothetical protein BP01DRAFT_375803 [Aspergillus saccharolyticus JOP 1030-1]PYH42988.1 hypothetical protein BP01DRAFT_375803 [Aspergillus saccharolyticus JOP 1030-1]
MADTTPPSTTETTPADPSPQPDAVVKKRIIRKKRRPARVQVEADKAKEIQAQFQPQSGTTYNIYYNKWAGGDREDSSQAAAQTRCNLARDSGYTKADAQPGAHICLHFARGLCHRGQDCEYLHRRPTIHDITPPQMDVFGREKFNDYRDDMGGVGSFLRQNRTIYVGKIHVREVVARHFAEWGEIDRIRVLTSRGVAFVTYKTEAMAQFAKEAMAHQSLDHNEILNVRWATQDPNPLAQKREARRIEEQAAEAIRRALPAEFIAQIEGKDAHAKRQKTNYDLEGYDEPDQVRFAVGLRKTEHSQQEQLALPAAEDHRQQEEPSQPQIEQGGIFSSSTLAALGAARASVSAKPQQAAPAGPLVAYDSDDE